MLRRSLCALSAVIGLSAVPSAEAHPPVVYPQHSVHYAPVVHTRVEVLYRGCAAEPWRVYRTYHSERQAHYAARHLRVRGFEVFVRGC